MPDMIYFDEDNFVDDNIFKYEERLHSPLMRLQERPMVYCTYFHLDTNETTTDAGFDDIRILLGEKSPLRFHKIDNFPIYGMDQPFDIALQEEDQGLDMNYEGEGIILPNILRPVPNSFFIVNHRGNEFVFRITGIAPSSIMRDNVYKIQFRLEYINEEMYDQLVRQTTEEYKCILDNIGTEVSCLLETSKVTRIQEITNMLNRIRSIYLAVFYKERYNCCLGEFPGGKKLYDPLQCIFLNKNGIFTRKREFKNYSFTLQYEDSRSPLKYEKSIYRFMEHPDKNKVTRFPYMLFSAMDVPETQFAQWNDASVLISDVTVDFRVLEPNYIFSQAFVDAVRTNQSISSPYGELLRKYIVTQGDLDINDIPLDLYEEIIDLDANIEVYFSVPLVTYVINKTIEKYIKLKY